MINWVPFSPKQLAFIHNSDAKMNICTGSVRSGKTIACTIRWINYLIEGPEADYVMMGKSLGTLKRNVINDLFDIVGKGNAKWVDRQQGEMRILGKRVYAVGAATEEAEERIRGATFAGAYCDEANLYPETVWMQLQARLSIDGAKTFANCNPDSPYHWFYQRVLKNKALDKKIWQFCMDDNLSLNEAYKKQLQGQFSGVFYKRFIEGIWCVADGKIYDTFDPKIHCCDTAPIVSTIPENCRDYYIGCDQGTSVTCSWSAMCRDKRTNITYKIGEYYYVAKDEHRQKDDAEYFRDFQLFIEKYIPKNFRHNLPVYGDPAASSWDAMLTNHCFNYRHADNEVLEGIKFVLTQLNTGKYFIDNECKKTIEEYDNYCWDETAQEKGEDKPRKFFDHSCVVGDTEVWTRWGKKKIKDLVGYEGSCYTYDFANGSIVEKPFFNVVKTRENAEVYEVELTDGRIVRGTSDHKIYTAGGWKTIGELTTEDNVGVINNSELSFSIVKSVTFVSIEDVYDMTVEDTHNFFVNDGIVISNCDSDRYALYTHNKNAATGIYKVRRGF